MSTHTMILLILIGVGLGLFAIRTHMWWEDERDQAEMWAWRGINATPADVGFTRYEDLEQYREDCRQNALYHRSRARQWPIWWLIELRVRRNARREKRDRINNFLKGN